MPKTICILGAGTYGSYLAHVLRKKNPDSKIILVEVGNRKTQNEKSIGFQSKVVNGKYQGATKGRFFGLGGTSAKWGGQMLFYSNNDFKDCSNMAPIIEANLKYRDTVLKRFFKRTPKLSEQHLANGEFFIKEGIWLKSYKRNLFKFFKIKKTPQIEILEDHRITRLCVSKERICSVILLDKNLKEKKLKADTFYLTCGALENVRIMHESGLLNMPECTMGFGDHVSLRCFKLRGKPMINNHDFSFRFWKGSLLTKRIVGNIEGTSAWAHPIYNEEFKLFTFLKNLIYHKKILFRELRQSCLQLPLIIPLMIKFFFRKKVYLYGPWYISIDIELSKSHNSISPSNLHDQFNQRGMDITFQISKDTLKKIERFKKSIKKILEKNNLSFVELNEHTTHEKLEDVYHPFNLYGGAGIEINKLINPLSNLHIFDTGLLNQAGGINPTASIFCLIENHVDNL